MATAQVARVDDGRAESRDVDTYKSDSAECVHERVIRLPLMRGHDARARGDSVVRLSGAES
jgi:hypothetical protein